MGRIVLEICAESAAEARQALAAGADRVELCRALAVGGLTPPPELVAEMAAGGGACAVLVRPRAGGFVFSAAEIDLMERQIGAAAEAGAGRIVVGALRADGAVDEAAMRRLVARARPLPVTFHRAFDQAPYPLRALEQVIATGCDQLLTSGGAATAVEGTESLRRLVESARGRLVVMAGGGVRSAHVARLVRAAGLQAVHSSARLAAGGPAEPREVRALRAALAACDEP